MRKEKKAPWIKKMVAELSETVAPDSERTRQALAVIQQAIDEKQLYYKPSPLRLLGIQLQYISPASWVIQAGFLLTVLFLLRLTSMAQRELADYLWWSSVTAAWMGMMACADLGHHLSRGMAELEQSCYINLPQLWTIKMILMGTVDLLILGLCSGGISHNTQTPIWQVGVYLLVPFVLSNLCCLLFLSVLRERRNHGAQLALAVVLALAALGPSLADVYNWGSFGVWLLILAAGCILLAEQLREYYKKIAGGEILCWN